MPVVIYGPCVLLQMSLQKNITFRGGTEIRPDERMFMIHQVLLPTHMEFDEMNFRICLFTVRPPFFFTQLNGMPVNQSRVFVYPNLYALHSMTAECGKPIEGSKSEDDSLHIAGKRNILLPPTQKLRAEILESNGTHPASLIVPSSYLANCLLASILDTLHFPAHTTCRPLSSRG